MCNNLHEEGFRPIPKHGVGWKIFGIGVTSPDDNSELSISSIHGTIFERAEDGWVEWKWSGIEEKNREFGFCFFLKRRDAVDAAKKWYQCIGNDCNPCETCVVMKIEYDQGLGEYNENNFIKGVRTALAKRFRIIGIE